MAVKIGFNAKMMENGDKMTSMISSHVKAEAEKVLATGSLKFELPSVYPVVNGAANESGTSQFLSRTVNCASEVGEVIVAMNATQNLTVFANYGLKHGFETVTDMIKAEQPLPRMMGETVRLLLEWLGGGKGKGYVSPFEGDSWEADGFHCVKVSPQRAREVFERTKQLGLGLQEIVQFGTDCAAVTRLNAESTIDSDKKVKLIVVVGLPGMANLAGITQMGRKDMEVFVDWKDDAKRSFIKVNDKITTSLEASETGGDGSYKKSWRDKETREWKKHLWLCDFLHLMRRSLFSKLHNFANELCEYGTSHVQQFDPKEITRITDVLNSFGPSQSQIIDTILEIKGWWQTASAVARQEIKNIQNGAAVSKDSLAFRKADIDIAKEEKAIQYKHLSNRMRLYIDALEKTTKRTLSPEDRVRLIWAVLFEQAKAFNEGEIAWDKLSDFPSSILPEEYALWILDVMRDDPRVPQKTRDRIYPCGIMKSADIVNLRNLRGAKVRFIDGICYCNGSAIFRCSAPLDGVFEIDIEEEQHGVVRLFATHDIRSLIKVPAANRHALCVYLQSKDNFEDINTIVNAALDGKVVIKATRGNPLFVVNGEKIVLKASFQGKANRANNLVVGGEQGVSGIVNIAKTFEFITDSGATRYSAFLLLSIGK